MLLLYSLLQWTCLFIMIASTSSLRLHMSSSSREIKILIHGTKNAYTTIRKNDIILYKLDPSTQDPNNNEQSKGLGVFLDNDVLFPLCNYHSGRYVPYISFISLILVS